MFFAPRAAVKLANQRRTKPAYERPEASQVEPAFLIVSPSLAPSKVPFAMTSRPA